MLRRGCQSYIQPVTGKFSNIFFEIDFFIFSLLWSKNNAHFWKKNFRKGFQNCFLCVQRTIWEIKKLMKTFVNFIITSDFKQKRLRILAKNFRQADQNCFLTVRKKILEKKFFRIVLFSFFEHFNGLRKTFSGVLAENSRQACRNSIPCVKRNVLRKFFWKRNFRTFKYFPKLDGRFLEFD